jgi:hypothetical protein
MAPNFEVRILVQSVLYVYRFLPHHTLKVIPADAKPIKVRITDEY